MPQIPQLHDARGRTGQPRLLGAGQVTNSRSPSGERFRCIDVLRCGSNAKVKSGTRGVRSMPVSTSQIFRSLLDDADPIRVPLELTARALTAATWPSKHSRSAPVASSQIRTVVSSAAQTTLRPLGRKASAPINSPPPRKRADSLPLSTPQTDNSRPAATASNRSSGENTRPAIASSVSVRKQSRTCF